MKKKFDRIQSGIIGLDDIIEGGFIQGSTNLISGMTGTCKTIFGAQFLYHGLKKGENGVYVSLEQDTEDIIEEMLPFGFDFAPYVKKKKMAFVDEFPSTFPKLEKAIFRSVVKVHAKRLVLDSLSIMQMGIMDQKDKAKLRRDLLHFFKALRKMNMTSLLVTEIPEDNPKKISRYGIEEFIADSVITMNYLEYAAGGVPRSLIIRKMRKTDHGVDIYPFQVTNKGIEIKKD